MHPSFSVACCLSLCFRHNESISQQAIRIGVWRLTFSTGMAILRFLAGTRTLSFLLCLSDRFHGGEENDGLGLLGFIFWK
jgi:hypothetical protein